MASDFFLISVIVPVFNSQQTVSKCIESLLAQKTKHVFEIIVVNDASTDNTEKELQYFFKRIFYVKNEKNKGPAFCRNLGARKAKGEIFCFIDADCIAEKNWVEELIKPFSEKNVAAVQGAYRTRQKELIARFVQEEIQQRYAKMRKARFLDWVGSYSAAYRREIFLSEGGFDESFPIASGEDPDLSFRVAKKGGKIVFNEKAIVYHIHPDTVTKYLNTKFWRAYYRVFLYKKHAGKMLQDSYTPQFLKLRIIGFPVFALSLFFALFHSINAFVGVIVFFKLFYFFTAVPFSLKAMQKDFLVSIVSPILLFLRDLAFALGGITGTLKLVFK